MSRRALITGLGVVSPLGIGWAPFWSALTGGTIGTGPITAFDTSRYPVGIGGEVHQFEPAHILRHTSATAMGRPEQLACVAARLAWADAGLEGQADPGGTGVIFGVTFGSMQNVESLMSQGERGAGPGAAGLNGSELVAKVARELGAAGPCRLVSTACAAGNYAVAIGADLIHRRQADVVVVGGVDALSEVCFGLFGKLGTLAPERCQPFDRDRKGLVVSEGAGVLVLEAEDHARARGVTAYGSVMGWGFACDAYHPTSPHPEGRGAILAMRRSLAHAELNPADIAYISAHGTGTPANDLVESRAIHTVFASHATVVAVSSIKSMLGHMMGAASAVEAVACALTLKTGVIPPTANFAVQDPAIDLDVVPNQSRRGHVRYALSNAFAFGGNVGVIVLGQA